MLFIRLATTVPVPRVYAIYTATEIPVSTKKSMESNYIVMERLKGNTLLSEWELLTPPEKERISASIGTRSALSPRRDITPV